jgi:hypothetical protein
VFGVPDELLFGVARQRENIQTSDYFQAQLRYPSTYPHKR